MKTEATRLQAEASDQWAYYQAKSVKAAIRDASRSAWVAAGKPVPPEHAAEKARYTAEQEAIKMLAETKERERDAASREADQLLRRHHGFANAVALMQAAIALGAVAALTRIRWIWVGSLLIGGTGLVLFGRLLVP